VYEEAAPSSSGATCVAWVFPRRRSNAAQDVFSSFIAACLSSRVARACDLDLRHRCCGVAHGTGQGARRAGARDTDPNELVRRCRPAHEGRSSARCTTKHLPFTRGARAARRRKARALDHGRPRTDSVAEAAERWRSTSNTAYSRLRAARRAFETELQSLLGEGGLTTGSEQKAHRPGRARSAAMIRRQPSF